MAFRTNLVPAIEERTVSGSSVSFNSAFALPLKACKVRVNITQSGSGTPTLLNRRPFVNISSLGITHNNILSNVPLGNDYYDFELNLDTGILTSYWYVFRADEYTWRESGSIFYCTDPSVNYRPEYIKKNGVLNIKSDVYDTNDTNDLSVYGNTQNRTYYIKDTQYLGNITGFRTHLTNDNVMLAYELVTPITIQLSPTELSSIIGNNTFSTDTGTLEIAFADLQEKSASGAVATFNTALAMPLSSCNIAVNAWQEGSGNPSPSNVRPIHGFSEVNATRAGKNLFDKSKGKVAIANTRFIAFGVDDFTDTIPNGSLWLKAGNYVFSVSGENSTLWESFGIFDISGTRIFVSYNAKFVAFTIPNSGAYKFSMSIKGEVFVSWDNYDMQLEAGSTATAFEPYVTPTIYTIQLGQEVYGAEVDAVNGVMSKTYKKIILDGTQDIALLNWRATATSAAWCYVPTVTPDFDFSGIRPIYCPILKSVSYGAIYSGAIDYQCAFYNHDTPYGLFIRYGDISLSTKEAINEFLSNNPIEIIYPVIEPIESNIGATPISTNIGNNTIFADTGDIDLTFKDLDIAKRGNFREVFRLPS